MLRSYYSYTFTNSRMPFQFNFIDCNLKNKEKNHLKTIEHAINVYISDYYASEYSKNNNRSINITNLDFILSARLTLKCKNILNQYDIGHFDKYKWCGITKYTIIKLDKVVGRILASHQNRNSDKSYNKPIEQIISNSIDIIPSKLLHASGTPKDIYRDTSSDTYRHDYLNPANKAQSRKLHRIFNV